MFPVRSWNKAPLGAKLCVGRRKDFIGSLFLLYEIFDRRRCLALGDHRFHFVFSISNSILSPLTR